MVDTTRSISGRTTRLYGVSRALGKAGSAALAGANAMGDIALSRKEHQTEASAGDPLAGRGRRVAGLEVASEGVPTGGLLLWHCDRCGNILGDAKAFEALLLSGNNAITCFNLIRRATEMFIIVGT